MKLLLMIGLLFSFYSCGSSSSSSSQTRTYQGAGSKWIVELNEDSTFSMLFFSDAGESEPSMVVTGTYEQNAQNQFLSLTVTETTGIGTPAIGAVIQGLEIPNTAVFLTPFSGSVPIVAIPSGSCPSADFAANWIVTKPMIENGMFPTNGIESDGSGTAVFTTADNSFTVTSAGVRNRQFNVGDSVPFTINMSSDCQNGLAQISEGGEDFDMYFTDSGVMIVKFPENMGEQIILGLPQADTELVASDLNGIYSVFYFNGGDNLDLSEATINPAQLTIADGAASLRQFSNVTDNTVDSTVIFTGSPFGTSFTATEGAAPDAYGLFMYNLSGGNFDGARMTCSAVVTSDPSVILCIGYYYQGVPDQSNLRPITLLGRNVE